MRHVIDWWVFVATREDDWSRPIYDTARARGQGKYRALRGLGARWTRILWRCWTDRTPTTAKILQLPVRRTIKDRGYFPTDDFVIKLLWLAICDIEDKRARARQADRGKPANKRTAPPRLIEGSTQTAGNKLSPPSTSSAKTVTSNPSTS